MMFITFSMYVLLEGGVVTPRKVFVCLSLLVVVRLFSVHYAVDGMTRFSQGWVALTRIKVCIIMCVCVCVCVLTLALTKCTCKLC